MAELTLVEAVNDALHTELARDEDVMVLGEDVGRAGGVFRATADDPRAYIDLARVEEERARECVGRFEKLLRERGVLSDELVESTRKDAEDLMRAGIAAAEAEAPPDPELVFTHAYVDPPENFRNG